MNPDITITWAAPCLQLIDASIPPLLTSYSPFLFPSSLSASRIISEWSEVSTGTLRNLHYYLGLHDIVLTFLLVPRGGNPCNHACTCDIPYKVRAGLRVLTVYMYSLAQCIPTNHPGFTVKILQNTPSWYPGKNVKFPVFWRKTKKIKTLANTNSSQVLTQFMTFWA